MSDKVTTKDAFLEAMTKPDIAMGEVDTPGFGSGSVRVKEMSGSIRNRLEAAYAAIRNGGNTKALDEVNAQLIAGCVLDENDRPFLTASQAKQFIAARPKLAFRIRDAVIDLSATSEEDVEALTEVFDNAQS